MTTGFQTKAIYRSLVATFVALIISVFSAFYIEAVDLNTLMGPIANLDPRNYDSALELMNSRIKANPTNPAARLLQVRILLEQRKFDQALSQCNQWMSFDTNTINLGALAFRGMAYFGKQDFSDAISDFSVCINQKPLAPVYCLRAGAYENISNYDAAISDYSSALKIDSANPQTYMFRSECYYSAGKFDAAIDDINFAILIQPFFPSAYASRGQVYLQKGDYAKAIEDCTKALLQDPKCSLAYNNLAWALAVSPDDKLRDGKRAVLNATRACELDGWKTSYSIGTLAAAYAEVGDFTNAIKWQTEGLKYETDSNSVEVAQQRLKLYQAGRPYHVGISTNSP